LFWIGFGIPAVILGYNLLVKAGVAAGLDEIPLTFKWQRYIAGTPFEGVHGGHARFHIFFTMIGLSFLIPAKISFSLWLFSLLYVVQLQLMVWGGYGTGGTSTYKNDGALYRSKEYSYLTATDGLLNEVEMAVGSVIVAMTRGTGLRAEGDVPEVRQTDVAAEADVSAEDGLAAVLATVTRAFDANQHRVKNYAGALVEMAQGLIGATLATSPDGEEWYAEWVVVGDSKMCPDCTAEGARGIIPSSAFQRWPGSVSLRCQRHCRCVTVWWTAAEVADGDAESLND